MACAGLSGEAVLPGQFKMAVGNGGGTVAFSSGAEDQEWTSGAK
jgi:hypothetical protein